MLKKVTKKFGQLISTLKGKQIDVNFQNFREIFGCPIHL